MSENENINEKINEKAKENGKKIFGVLLMIILSAVVLAILIKLLFTNSKINQGRFRVTDALVTSSAEFVDKSEGTGKWMYDVSQTNTLSLLINTSGAKISRAYITDAKVAKSGVEINEKDSDIHILCNTNDTLELATNMQDSDTVVYDINITNRNVLENFEIPEDITEIKHDASIFNLAGVKNEDLTFTISFTFNMQEENGKLSTMKVTLELPCANIVQSGVYVEKLNIENFVFKTN